MKNYIRQKIEKIEDRTAKLYGLEVPRTIFTFRITDIIRKIFRID